MTKQDWAPEPWEFDKDNGGIIDANGKDILEFPDGSMVFRDDDAKRIAACVNASAGVPTEVLPELSDLFQKFILFTKPIVEIKFKKAPDDMP